MPPTGSRDTTLANTIRRGLAFALDWCLIALWGGALFGVVMLLRGGEAPHISSPWTAEAVGLVAMTLPVVMYFALIESSAWQASVGKRALGLIVTTQAGERLSLGGSLLRTGIKFLPWECGHMLAQHLYVGGEVAVWMWGVGAAAFVLPLVWVVTIVVRGRAPYDVWAGARVGVRHPTTQMDGGKA
jgi:uncharacterized RDD family membrane protein YckC